MKTLSTYFTRILPALVFLLGFPLCQSARAAGAEPSKILMVGNSLTYTYDIPKILGDLAQGAGKKVDISRHVAGGKSLSWHWANKSGKPERSVQEVIEGSKWDLVILQDNSSSAVKPETREEFKTSARQFFDLITKNKETRMMFYSGFVRKPDITAADVKPVIDMYTEQADALQVACAPVVLAFLNCREKAPQLALLDNQAGLKYAQNKTGTHQSPFGSYLAACTIYSAIYDQSPVGNPSHTSGDGTVIEDADAALAQQIAWDTWCAYKASRKPAS